MVFLKINDSIQSFLMHIEHKIPENPKIIKYSILKELVSNFNETHALDAPYYLNEMIKYDDILYTSDYELELRDIEYNTEEWLKYKEELKQKHDEREYQKMINNVSNKETNKFTLFSKGESVKDFEKSISFGMSFIFSLFLSGLSGYYFGIYILNFDMNKSLIIAAIATIITVIIETTLFIIKTDKMDKEKNKKNIKEKKN